MGTTLLGVGSAVLLLEIYRTAPDTWWLPILSIASLRVLSRPLRVLIFGGIGIGLILIGIWGINRSLLAPFRRSGKPVLDELTDHRRKERGPRIVTIGGGHGLSTLLRGLKSYSYNITAVVTVADDGGSSGRIRRTQGIPPPGDIRNCLAALSSDEALMTQLFQYRFSDGNPELDGHPFGNLFISALSEITGSFEDAVVESGRVLAVHGRVLPATLHDVRLVADVQLPHNIAEVRVEGESTIPKFPGNVQRVWLEPNNPAAYPQVIQAILASELIVIGPGSLFTSIIPDLLVPDIVAAIQASRALKIYVCNVATQPGETDGYTCEDHIKVLNDHIGESMFDIIVINNKYEGQLPSGVEWVKPTPEAEIEYPIYQTDVLNGSQPWRHDSVKLARAIMDLYQERTGPLVE
ncbi:MAG: YvcK family protein [Anaerolineales bacterium]